MNASKHVRTVSTPPTRTGVSLAPSGTLSVSDVIALAVQAESLGYDSVWIPESWGHDAVSLLGAIAASTSRIRIAAGVINVFSRTPALIAQTAATLQLLSDGRFILGLGTSGPRVIEHWHGLSYSRPIERTQDYVEIIRMALRGDRVDVARQNYRLQGFRLALPQSPTPIFIAALGPKNIRLTARLADGWLPIFAARGQLAPLIEVLHSCAAESGRSPSEIDVAAYIPCLTGARSADLLRAQIAYYVGAMGTFYNDFMRRMGFVGEADAIASAWREGNRIGAVRAVSDALLDVCAITGDGTGERDRLREYRAEGVALPIITPPHGASRHEIAHTLEVLAPLHRSPVS